MHLLALVLTALAAIANGASLSIPHETRPVSSHLDWAPTERLHPSSALPAPLRIGLVQSNLHTLHDLLLSVSHPDSEDYGRHWSPQQIADHFAPSQTSVDAVKAWLTEHGIDRQRITVSISKGWIEVKDATVQEVEDLLEAEYNVYTHTSGVETVGCHSYTVPEHIKEHVDIITPTVHFAHKRHAPRRPVMRRNAKRFGGLGAPDANPGPKTNGEIVTVDLRPKPNANSASGNSSDLSTCDQFITPDCLRALYNINRTPTQTDKNSYGIVELTPQAFLGSDLDLFFGNFSPSQVGTRPTLISIDGGTAQTQNQSFDFNGESDLDLEYAFALTNPQPLTLLQAGDIPEGASFNNWLDAVDGSYCTFEGGDDPDFDGIYPDNLPGGFDEPESCGIVAPPNVISVSYGGDEADFTVAYAQRQCTEYGKLGMMGTSVLYSSGDNGVAGNGGVCLNAKGQPSNRGTRFNPDFPAVCPFITAVGATQINPNATVNDPESACEQVIFSGGGFSNFFDIPSYQQAAVSSFLTNHPPPFTSAQFNNSGTSRAYPDLSANGANYVIGIDGEFELVFGTSASSPVTGSIITLINDARIEAGKGPIGFLNPSIYSDTFQAAFNDITTGGNQGCGTPGFTSTTGWDPVTGVGTPNMEKLLPLFLALP